MHTDDIEVDTAGLQREHTDHSVLLCLDTYAKSTSLVLLIDLCQLCVLIKEITRTKQ